MFKTLTPKYNSNELYLFNDDCINVLKDINDKTINLFVLDLPYGQTSCGWDSLINLDDMWKEIKRTMKSNAQIIFFCTTKFGVSLINSNPKWFRYDLVWKKSRKVGFLSANKMPLRQHEMIYVFSDNKAKGKEYNPQKTSGKPYKARHGVNIEGYYRDGKKYTLISNENKGDRHPTSILDYEKTILEFNNPSKSYHKTAKPVDLLEWIIKSYSNENDVICDFTMGSGSTGIVCYNTKRKFIGVELNNEIYNIAEERIKLKLTEQQKE